MDHTDDTDRSDETARAARDLAMVAEHADEQLPDDIPMERWGRDHWSTFAYAETCAVDRRGELENSRMRCLVARHSHLAFSLPYSGKLLDSTEYPTTLRDGTVSDHDDWDCLADMVTVGLLQIDTEPTFGVHPIRVHVVLTALGWQIAGQLRRHVAEHTRTRQGNSAYTTFVPQLIATGGDHAR